MSSVFEVDSLPSNLLISATERRRGDTAVELQTKAHPMVHNRGARAFSWLKVPDIDPKVSRCEIVMKTQLS